MYKKVYLEVTNICNLNCSFCIKNNREKIFVSLNNFKIILDKIKGYTKYLYFHVSGEPLMHPNINELINVASKDFYINVTTNGFLIDKIKDNHNIRQINISLHSFKDADLNNYLNNICSVIDNLHDETYFSLRFWVENEYTAEIVKYLSLRYQKDIKLVNGFEIIKNVFIGVGKEFVWPELNNNIEVLDNKCYALKDHIGILSNGVVVPCCLDVNGIIKLGNIYEDDLDTIISSKRYQAMLKGFQNNKRIEKLCQKCNFLE